MNECFVSSNIGIISLLHVECEKISETCDTTDLQQTRDLNNAVHFCYEQMTRHQLTTNFAVLFDVDTIIVHSGTRHSQLFVRKLLGQIYV